MLALPPAVREKAILGEAPASITCCAYVNRAVLRPELATTQLRSKWFPTPWAAGLNFSSFHKAVHPHHPAFFPLASAKDSSLSWGKPHVLDYTSLPSIYWYIRLEDSNVIHSRLQLRLAPSHLNFLRLASVKLHSSLFLPTTNTLRALEGASVTRPTIHPPNLVRVKTWKMLGQPSCSDKTNESNKFPHSDTFNHNSSYLTKNLGNANPWS